MYGVWVSHGMTRYWASSGVFSHGQTTGRMVACFVPLPRGFPVEPSLISSVCQRVEESTTRDLRQSLRAVFNRNLHLVCTFGCSFGHSCYQHLFQGKIQLLPRLWSCAIRHCTKIDRLHNEWGQHGTLQTLVATWHKRVQKNHHVTLMDFVLGLPGDGRPSWGVDKGGCGGGLDRLGRGGGGHCAHMHYCTVPPTFSFACSSPTSPT